MPFLIDGHNVISALEDIDLEDPHDEVKLVFKLRAWAGRIRRKAIVIFDGGIPGGYSRKLSRDNLKVIFAARQHTNADRIIHARLRRLRDAPNWTVVSSDHEVLDSAREVGARVMTAQEFAEQLQVTLTIEREKPEALASGELEEWLEVFGDAEDIPIPPSARAEATQVPSEPTPSVPPVGKRKARPPARPKLTHTERTLGEQVDLPMPDDVPLDKVRPPIPDADQVEGKPTYPSDREVEAWLDVFEEPLEPEPTPARPKRKRRPKPKSRQRKRDLAVAKENPDALDPDDVKAWLDVFADRPTPPPEPAPASKPKRRKQARGQRQEETPQRRRKKRRKKVRTSKLLEVKRRQAPVDEVHTEKGELTDEDLNEWYRRFGKEPGQ
jgi:predicted RNA-binding protein with PIN domain